MKEGLGEQGELTDDESDAGELVEDQVIDQDIVEIEEEGLQDDAISVGTEGNENSTDQDAMEAEEDAPRRHNRCRYRTGSRRP
jgi:hypothetical protein